MRRARKIKPPTYWWSIWIRPHSQVVQNPWVRLTGRCYRMACDYHMRVAIGKYDGPKDLWGRQLEKTHASS